MERVRSDPKNPAHYLSLCESHYFNREDNCALVAISKAIELLLEQSKTCPAELYLKRGYFYRRGRFNYLARQDFDRAVELSPSFLSYLLNGFFVMTCLTDSRVEGLHLALEKFNKAVEIGTEDAKLLSRVLVHRGVVNRRLKRFQDSEIDITRAIELVGDNNRSYFQRGCTYFRWKKFRLALNDYGKSIEINSEHTRSYSNRAIVFFEMSVSASMTLTQKKRREYLTWSIRDCTKAMTLGCKTGTIYLRGKCYAVAEMLDLAIDDFSRVLNENPTLHYVYTARGNCFLRKKLFEKAIVDYSSSVRIGRSQEAVFLRNHAVSELKRYIMKMK